MIIQNLHQHISLKHKLEVFQIFQAYKAYKAYIVYLLLYLYYCTLDFNKLCYNNDIGKKMSNITQNK